MEARQGGKKTDQPSKETREFRHAAVAEQLQNEREEHVAEGEAGRGAGPRATFQPDSVTAADIPRAHLPPVPPNTPQVDPELSALSSHHSDNPLSREIRAMRAKDVTNPARLREAAEKTHVHDHPGMSGSA